MLFKRVFRQTINLNLQANLVNTRATFPNIIRFQHSLVPQQAFLCSRQSLNCSHTELVNNSVRWASSASSPAERTVRLDFVERDGNRVTVNATPGKSILDAAIANDIELEGACEGTLSCSTCHVIFRPEDFARLPSTPTDEELDMLDLAYGLTNTSRLGCQVKVTSDMQGWLITIPSAVADARSGGKS